MGLWAKQVDDTQASGPSRWTTRQHLGQAGGRYESIWAKQVDDTRASGPKKEDTPQSSGPKKEDTPQSSGPGKRIRSEHLGQRCNAHVRTRSPSPTVNKQSANSYINKQNPIKITITSQQNRQQMGVHIQQPYYYSSIYIQSCDNKARTKGNARPALPVNDRRVIKRRLFSSIGRGRQRKRKTLVGRR